MIRVALVVAALSLCSQFVSAADTIVQPIGFTESINVSGPTGGFPSIGSILSLSLGAIDQFDPSLGELTDVRLDGELSFTDVSGRFTNTFFLVPVSRNVGISPLFRVILDIPVFPPGLATLQEETTDILNTQGAIVYGPSGGGLLEFPDTVDPITEFLPPAAFDDVIGTGTIDVSTSLRLALIDADSGSTLGGFSVSGFTYNVEFAGELIYEFIPIPEPSSLVVLLLSGMPVLLTRSRS